MKVLVLGGGDSPEREVSLRSAKAVANAARTAGFEVEEKDPAEGLSFFDSFDEPFIVLPILHGKGGEDGMIQRELESRKLPYLGSDSVSSANCFDKWLTRETLTRAGLPLANGALVTKDNYFTHQLAKQPHVLKVNRGGSSIGTLIVRQPGKVTPDQVNKVFELDSQAVLEKLIIGTELTVPILDKTALTPIEIRPPTDAEFDYDNKYNGATAELCPPQSVPAQVQQRAMELAEKTHVAMKCRHLSRVDIMLDGQGDIYILEINTIPGLTDQSLYPRSAAVAGLSMPELVEKFIELVRRDFGL